MNISCSIHLSVLVPSSAIATSSSSVWAALALRVIRKRMTRSAMSIARKSVEIMNMITVMDIRKMDPFIL
jgi:hypothetical protein